MGFRAWLRGRAAHLRVLDISGGYGVYERTFERVTQALQQHPELKAVYSVGGGNRAIVDAFAALDRPLEVFIGHDLDAENRQLLIDEKIAAISCLTAWFTAGSSAALSTTPLLPVSRQRSNWSCMAWGSISSNR